MHAPTPVQYILSASSSQISLKISDGGLSPSKQQNHSCPQYYYIYIFLSIVLISHATRHYKFYCGLKFDNLQPLTIQLKTKYIY